MKLEICDKLQFNKSKFFSSYGKISISMIIYIVLQVEFYGLGFFAGSLRPDINIWEEGE